MSLIEVEAKYPVHDLDKFRNQLEAMGASVGDSVRQADEYFAHPARDFAQTSEAFRLRSIGKENRLTYKGPLLDSTTKTREEIEIAFPSGPDVRESMRQLLTALGFNSVRVVEKIRQTFHLDWGERQFEVCLDHLPTLGDYVELETTSNEDDWQNARDTLVAFANELHLSNSERRSYLELLIAAKAAPESTN